MSVVEQLLVRSKEALDKVGDMELDMLGFRHNNNFMNTLAIMNFLKEIHDDIKSLCSDIEAIEEISRLIAMTEDEEDK